MNISKSTYHFLSNISWVVKLKKQMDAGEFALWRAKQIMRRWLRKNVCPSPLSHSYRFFILCVKRTEYIDFAINQINSLHYYSPYHVFDILCDDKCLKYFTSQRHKLDYPVNTRAISLVNNTKGIWQQYKIQTLLLAIQSDGILIDADMFWYSNPMIPQWQALFFAKAYLIKDLPVEKELVNTVFHHPEWSKFAHYTTGVVYLPYILFSGKLKKELLHFVSLQTKSSYSFLKSQEEKDNLRRLIDEMAINLAFQSVLKPEQITTLKGTDSPGDRNIVLSLYYGSMNKVNS